MSFTQSLLLGLLLLLGPPVALALLWSAESRAGLLGFLELSFRRALARFHQRPALTWIRWARRAHRGSLARAYITEAARTGDPEGLLEEGLLYWQGGYGTAGRELAASRFLWAAESGSTEAMYWVAENLRSDTSRPVDLQGARVWLRRGAQAGSGACMAALVHMLRCTGAETDLTEAIHWEARLKASDADPKPSRSAALVYRDSGEPDPLVRSLDRTVAVTEAWFERPGIKPLLPIIGWIAILLMVGVTGILLLLPFLYGGLFAIPLLIVFALLVPIAWRMHMDHRPGTAIRKHFSQAQAGDPQAAFTMGMACLQGRDGLPKDAGEARRWLCAAAESGHLEAMVEYAALLRWDLGGFKDPTAADAWLQRVAEAGHGGAQAQLTQGKWNATSIQN